MEFRRSLPSDATAIAYLEREIFSDAWGERDIISTIGSEGSMCYTAVKDGRLIAYILGRVIAPEGEIYRIAVAPEYRRRGIAYRLLDYAAKTERGRGLEVLFLEVRSKNTPAISLYESYGFERAGLRKKYYRSPEDDAIIMVKASRADLIN